MPRYKSRMVNWDRAAFVRGRRDRWVGERLPGELPFSPSLFPVATHPLVRELGPEATRFLLAQRLYDYLDWTVVLERDVIVPVVNDISVDRFALGGGPPLTVDALRIGVDEFFHSLEAVETKHKVIQEIGILPIQESFQPAFLRRLETTIGTVPPEERQIVRLLFSIVSETLITGILSKLPVDEDVVPVVRATVRHHAADEVRHHAVFASVLEILWNRWTTDQRSHFAPIIASFMEVFLMPDISTVYMLLQYLALSSASIGGVIEDVYSPTSVLADMRQACSPSLRAMRKVGLFDCPAFLDALGGMGLA